MTPLLLACGCTSNATDPDTGRPLCIAHVLTPEGHMRAFLAHLPRSVTEEDRHDAYLEAFHAERAIRRIEDESDDPMGYAEWVADDDQPLGFYEWVEQTYDEMPYWTRYTPVGVGFG